MDPRPADIGITLLMVYCLTPWLVGLWLGWVMHGRFASLGWWSLAPSFIRRWITSAREYIQQLEKELDKEDD